MNKKRTNFKKILAWVAVFVWMSVIFGLSMMKGSGENYFDLIYTIERKTFHVIEYFILCVLLCYALAQSFPLGKTVWLAVIISLLYASSDEWHQTFVFGREGAVRDVVIDLIGIILATVIVLKTKLGRKYVLNDSEKSNLH
jgi:VanZ family protein